MLQDVVHFLLTNDLFAHVMQQFQGRGSLNRNARLPRQGVYQAAIAVAKPAKLVLIGADDADRLLTNLYRSNQHGSRAILMFSGR